MLRRFLIIHILPHTFRPSVELTKPMLIDPRINDLYVGDRRLDARGHHDVCGKAGELCCCAKHPLRLGGGRTGLFLYSFHQLCSGHSERPDPTDFRGTGPDNQRAISVARGAFCAVRLGGAVRGRVDEALRAAPDGCDIGCADFVRTAADGHHEDAVSDVAGVRSSARLSIGADRAAT